ncbi:hypothetical protein [Micromonospora endolithica]|uniref:Secreted protein/lipoprotein n=1 Tax=Micromonospora endolithica TaxID=230091 RepID=A0A3A9ZLR3_9ACTN|nr:hypothetical protein [Micromonospora endolithica]RKN48286.1 hypothetical protein D7223_09715 [Micromonospora endolithica]TWJ24658.1 hypothetical protein JD76_04811 [Micromonospora endolithica]
MRGRQLRRWSTCLVVAATVVSSTACGGGDDTSAGTAAADAAPARTDRKTAELAAGKAALAAYSGYLTASREASGRSDPHLPELSTFVGDPLLTRLRLSIRQAKRNGAVRTGKLVSDPAVVSVSLDTVPPTVEIQDCLDATGYQLVYARDQKVVPGTRGTRHLVTATATRYPDGRWLISAGAAHQDQPC